MIAGPIQGRLFGGESNKLFREVTCVQGRLSQKSTTYTLVSLHRVSAFTNVSLHKCQPHDFNPDLEEAVMVWIEIMPASSRVSHLPASHILPFPVISILTKLDVSLNFNLDRYIHFHIVTPEWSSRRAESQPQSQRHFSSDRLDASFDFYNKYLFFRI